MIDKLNSEYIKENITHIGFYNKSEKIIWNEIDHINTKINIHNVSEIADWDISFNISDKNLLVNKENREIFFILSKTYQVFYCNIKENKNKILFKKGPYNGFKLEFLTSINIYKNTYPYYFVFKDKLTFKVSLQQDIDWDFFKNKNNSYTFTEYNNIPIEIDFSDNIYRELTITNFTQKKYFTLILKEGEEPQFKK